MGAARPRARAGWDEGCPDCATGVAGARWAPSLPVPGYCRALLLQTFTIAALLLLYVGCLPAVDATLNANDLAAMQALSSAWCAVGGKALLSPIMLGCGTVGLSAH